MSLYNESFDFDKSIMVIRRTNMEDRVVNGIVLERKRMDPEMPLEIKEAKVMIVKLDLKPVKESWLKENSKYEEILHMENDRVAKSKEIVDAMLATGAKPFSSHLLKWMRLWKIFWYQGKYLRFAYPLKR